MHHSGCDPDVCIEEAPFVGTMPCACPRPVADAEFSPGRGQAQGIVPTNGACETCRFPPVCKHLGRTPS